MKSPDEENIDQKKRELTAYIGELETKQSNILWEDAHRNSRGVDKLLWKGSSNARPIERAGIAVFGFLFLITGGGVALLAWEQQSLMEGILSGLLLLLAARLLRNALRGLGKRDV